MKTLLNKAVNNTRVVTYFSLSWSRKSSGIWFMSEDKYFRTFWRVIGTIILENFGNSLPSDMTCIFSSTAVTQLHIFHAVFFLPVAYIISSHTHLQTFCLWFFFKYSFSFHTIFQNMLFHVFPLVMKFLTCTFIPLSQFSWRIKKYNYVNIFKCQI